MSFYQRAKRSLRTCIRSNWNVYSRHCIRINQHWLIERVCCYCITQDRMSSGWQGIRYSDLVGRLCVILLTHLTLHHQIMTSSIPWTIIFGVNPSPMKQTCTKLSRTSLPPPIFTARGFNNWRHVGRGCWRPMVINYCKD
ncbi:hypothetical protein TNCV_274691 [Trichonephila clavipes]|nr:hypothetical protein TNCV_274691 [Trichonephila clavipes]